MDLNEILVFIQVVKSGSFVGAARALQMPLSTVSHKIQGLEKRLGLTLIQRTTRKLHVTAPGQAYFRQCVEGIAAIESAENEMMLSQSEPSGILRITSFFEMASSLLPGIISSYSKLYPKVRVELIITDRTVDLISENFDLAVRVGELKDSGLIAKKIGASCFGLFASPKYLLKAPKLNHPRDLAEHPCLRFQSLGQEAWKLSGPSGVVVAPLKTNILMNNLTGLKTMAILGDGIVSLPTYFAKEELKEKKLVRVLPEWRSALVPIHFVYPGQKFLSPKVKSFISLAIGPLKDSFLEGY